jgi:hypothetical protein
MYEDLFEREKFLVDETLTVAELIDILKKYPEKTKVIATWESTIKPLKMENIYVSHTNTLYLDADYNFYKNDLAKDPKENET